jgi:hypothetical protein
MGQRYTFKFLWIIFIAQAVAISFAFTLGTSKYAKADTIFNKKNKKNSYFKNGLTVGTLPPLKASPYVLVKPAIQTTSDKLLSNVQVYPNPIVDQMNLKYMVSRNTNVTIRLMDVLGNNVATLYSDRVETGEVKLVHDLKSNRLTSGFYFLKVTAGTESIIKRVTIL